MTHPVKSPRKLIEVALPLDAINKACVYDSTLAILAGSNDGISSMSGTYGETTG